MEEFVTRIEFDDENEIQWVKADFSVGLVSPFEVLTHRSPGDYFLNTFNEIISNAIACNTNVQIGDYAHVYYSTLYTSKSTQKEDTLSYLNASNAIVRRISKAVNDDEEQRDPDFVEGLGMMLAGIRAHLSANVHSSTMGHLLVTQGSRFTFSHEFSHMLLSQLEDKMNGLEMSFRYRSGKVSCESNVESSSRQSGPGASELDKGKVHWADCFANDILCRPEALENVCACEQMMRCEKKTVNSAMKRSTMTRNKERMYFSEEHPGSKFACLERLDIGKEKIPIISVRNEWPDVADLEPNDTLSFDVMSMCRTEIDDLVLSWQSMERSTSSSTMRTFPSVDILRPS